MPGMKRVRAPEPASKKNKTMSSDHSKLMKLQRAVAQLAPEMKWLTSTGSFTNIDDAIGSIASVSLIAQGSDDFNRIGNVVSAKQFTMNIKLISGGAGGGVATYKVYLIRDLDSNGTIPSISGTVNSIFEGSQPINQLLRTAENRFKILRQKTLSASQLGAGTTPYLFNWTLPLNFKMTFRGSAGTQANVGKHGLYIVIVSDDSTDTVDFAYSYQLGFTDV